MKKNTVYVDIEDGSAFAQDDHLREIAEARVYYVPDSDSWMPKPISGATVISAVPSYLMAAAPNPSGRWSR